MKEKGRRGGEGQDSRYSGILRGLEESECQGWKDSSAVRSTSCSYREPEFGSQHSCGMAAQLPLTTASGGSNTSTHTQHTCT